eukprot:1411864-Rhodomonas_salina.1
MALLGLGSRVSGLGSRAQIPPACSLGHTLSSVQRLLPPLIYSPASPCLPCPSLPFPATSGKLTAIYLATRSLCDVLYLATRSLRAVRYGRRAKASIHGGEVEHGGG